MLNVIYFIIIKRSIKIKMLNKLFSLALIGILSSVDAAELRAQGRNDSKSYKRVI